MKIRFYAALAAVAILALLGCDILNTVVNNTVGNAIGGAKGNTVANLWSDVPPIQGAQKISLDLPLTVQLAIQALIKTSAASEGGNIDSFDWIAFSTNQSPQQVAAFYTNQRMVGAGWKLDKDQPGCVSGGDTSGIGGAFCAFAKGKGTANEKASVLFIVPVQDDKTKQTQVYYVRLEGIIAGGTPTPKR
jgi:hypothetical protein